jgi:hypothetical protein
MATTTVAGETATGADEFAGALNSLTTPGGAGGWLDAIAFAGGAAGAGIGGAGGFAAGAAFADAVVVGIGIDGASAGAADAIGGAGRVFAGADGTGFAG